MFRLRSLFSLIPQLWNTLRTRPITVRYPFEPLKLPPYFRGRDLASSSFLDIDRALLQLESAPGRGAAFGIYLDVASI